MVTRFLIALILALATGGQTQPAGVKVSGRLLGVPTDGPPGLTHIFLSSRGKSRDLAVGPDGAFEFVNVLPGRATLNSNAPQAFLALEVGNKNIEGLELKSEFTQLLGQVTIDSGAPLPANRNPIQPVFRLEAREAAGKVVWHQFVRSDGMFGFLPLDRGGYQIRVTLVPAGYAVKSISYAGADALRKPVTLDPPQPFAFLRVVLTAAANAPANSPTPPPATAAVAATTGDATLIVSQSGHGPMYFEGALPFFTVRSTGSAVFREERRLGGEWCRQLQGRTSGGGRNLICAPSGASDSEKVIFPLPAGNYEISGYVRPCDGNCGALDAPRDECYATFSIRRGETLYAERVQTFDLTRPTGNPCTLTITSKPAR